VYWCVLSMRMICPIPPDQHDGGSLYSLPYLPPPGSWVVGEWLKQRGAPSPARRSQPAVLRQYLARGVGAKERPTGAVTLVDAAIAGHTHGVTGERSRAALSRFDGLPCSLSICLAPPGTCIGGTARRHVDHAILLVPRATSIRFLTT
jgi:hypothetical protein